MDAKRAATVKFALSAALIIVLFGVGAVLFVRHMILTAAVPQKKVVQEIHVIRPPPPPETPPPPPPPPEEHVDVHEPEPQPDPAPSDEPPPAEQLGLDAEGGAGSDGFGLVGRKGGRDLLASGGSAYAWYAGVLKGAIADCLDDDAAVRKGGSYSVLVQLWLRADGSIERAHLAQSTGDRDRDRALETAFERRCRTAQPPPADMPQPVSVRIASRT
ncbi:MAG TPA: TonB family protein [Steroidobacteraceae bacterium]|nr:TonB family protein [Steroidobacteraceae bacterium]